MGHGDFHRLAGFYFLCQINAIDDLEPFTVAEVPVDRMRTCVQLLVQ